MNLPRPQVDLDALRDVARRIQERYPAIRTLVGALEREAPGLVADVRQLADHAPAVLGAIQAEGEAIVRGEARELVRPLRELERFVRSEIDGVLVRAEVRAAPRARLPRKTKGRRVP